MLCRYAHNDAALIAGKIFDRNDIELEMYNDLAEFLQHATCHIESQPGGHFQEFILDDVEGFPTYDLVCY